MIDVLTWEDIEAFGAGPMPLMAPVKNRDGSSTRTSPKPILAKDRITFTGIIGRADEGSGGRNGQVVTAKQPVPFALDVGEQSARDLHLGRVGAPCEVAAHRRSSATTPAYAP